MICLKRFWDLLAESKNEPFFGRRLVLDSTPQIASIIPDDARDVGDAEWRTKYERKRNGHEGNNENEGKCKDMEEHEGLKGN